MPSYLDRIGAGLVIRDPVPLGYEFVPSELVGRDHQLESLASLFTGIDRPNISCRAAITGPVGSGKSVISRRFGLDLVSHLALVRPTKVVRVNCRNHPTTPQVMQRLITSLDARHPERGLGRGEILQSLRRHLIQDNLHLLIILDEIDHLLSKEGDDLLYQLLRIDEDQDTAGSVSLIIISQEPVLERLDASVLSRFGRSHQLSLQAYDRASLFQIVEQRASLALVDHACDPSIMRLIAEAASDIGDARLAIEMLDEAAKRAERAGRDTIEPKDVQRATSVRPTHVEPFDFDTLPKHASLVLLAAARRLRKEPEVSSGEIEQLYRLVCEEVEESARGHTTVYSHLKRLEQAGILTARQSTIEGGRGRTQYFSMPTLLPQDLVVRLEKTIR